MRAKQHYGLPQPALARLRERQAVPVSQRVPEAASICPSAPRPALPAALPALSSVPGRLISKPAPARRLDVRLRGTSSGPGGGGLCSPPSLVSPARRSRHSLQVSGWLSPSLQGVSPTLPGLLQPCLGAHAASFLLQPHKCIFLPCSPHQQEIGKKDVLTTAPEQSPVWLT